ncbi:unnamed protein product [Clonostachys rhizophaga]|uniref:Uncharacterized protein n=1 Tax=Clonostachys rhizophaga TaxID=160324 RepID=A0A9N9VPG4_9HYPO|nr:unnamed protein product [Clonostachys rhizophaga]
MYTESPAKAREPLAPSAHSAPTSVAEAPTTEQKSLRSVVTTPNVPETDPKSDKLDLPMAQSDVVNLKAQMENLQVKATPETLTRAQHRTLRFGRARQPQKFEWPESWAYSPEDPTAHHINMMRGREADERRRPGGTVFNKEGPITQIYARQYLPGNSDKVIVAFTKPTSDEDGTTFAKYVELDSEEEATARAEVYTPFVVGELPIKFVGRLG